MTNISVKTFCLALLAGGLLMVLALGLLFFLVLRAKAQGDGDLRPCHWTIRIEDQDGQPVPGVELVIVDEQSWKLWWEPIGSWSGPGSIYTDESGQATFELSEAYTFGGQALWVGSYVKDTWPSPAIQMRLRGYCVFSLLLGEEAKGTVIVTCYPSRLPGAPKPKTPEPPAGDPQSLGKMPTCPKPQRGALTEGAHGELRCRKTPLRGSTLQRPLTQGLAFGLRPGLRKAALRASAPSLVARLHAEREGVSAGD